MATAGNMYHHGRCFVAAAILGLTLVLSCCAYLFLGNALSQTIDAQYVISDDAASGDFTAIRHLGPVLQNLYT